MAAAEDAVEAEPGTGLGGAAIASDGTAHEAVAASIGIDGKGPGATDAAPDRDPALALPRALARAVLVGLALVFVLVFVALGLGAAAAAGVVLAPPLVNAALLPLLLQGSAHLLGMIGKTPSGTRSPTQGTCT